MALAIRIVLGILSAIGLYFCWVAVSSVIYSIRRGPNVATGLGVLWGFFVSTALSPFYWMAAAAVVVLTIKV
jgi:hypothetical protein